MRCASRARAAMARWGGSQGKGKRMRPAPGALPAVLSAAGFGLLLWLGVSVAVLPHGTGMVALRAPQMWALLLALGLLCAAAGSALAGARPRAARELLRAATPWQRRRNLLVAIAVVLALATGVLLTPGQGGAGRVLALSFAGMSLAGAAFGAVTADAVADAMQGAPATLPPLAVPARLLAALLTGLALMFALLSGLLAVGGGGFRMLTILLVLGVLAAATQWLDGRHARRDGRAAAGPAGRPAWWPWLLLAGVPGLALATASLGVGGITGWLWVVAIASFAGSLAAWPARPPAPVHGAGRAGQA